MSSQEKYISSLSASDELIGAVNGERVFSTSDHIREVKGERRDKKRMGHHKWRKAQGNCWIPSRLWDGPFNTCQTHGCMADSAVNNGSWYSTSYNVISQFLWSRYNVISPNLQNKSNGCMQTFLVRHVLISSNGGIVIERHNKICYDIIQLVKQDLSPNCVRGETLIHQGCRISEKKVNHRGSVPQTHGNMSIKAYQRDKWKQFLTSGLGMMMHILGIQ